MNDQRERFNRVYIKNEYDYLQSDKFKFVYEYVATRINDHEAASVLDVGCWTGMLADALLASEFDGTYLGIDISDKAIEEAKGTFRYKPGLDFDIADWRGPAPKQHFDSIYFGGVFYYVEDKQGFLYKFLEANTPSAIIIQDLASTDLTFLSDIKHIKRDVYHVNIPLNVKGSAHRNERQIHTIRLN